jgi:hypothetical protein
MSGGLKLVAGKFHRRRHAAEQSSPCLKNRVTEIAEDIHKLWCDEQHRIGFYHAGMKIVERQVGVLSPALMAERLRMPIVEQRDDVNAGKGAEILGGCTEHRPAFTPK